MGLSQQAGKEVHAQQHVHQQPTSLHQTSTAQEEYRP
jgi:hypothetical protein